MIQELMDSRYTKPRTTDVARAAPERGSFVMKNLAFTLMTGPRLPAILPMNGRNSDLPGRR